jgi:hypothetical protein
MTKDLPTRYLASPPPPDVEPVDVEFIDADDGAPLFASDAVASAIAWGVVLGLALAALVGRVVYVLATGG